MRFPEIILEDKSKKDLYNLLRQINKNFLVKIEIIYILSTKNNIAEYSNNSLILAEDSLRETVYELIAESLLEIENIQEPIEADFLQRKTLSENRERLNGIAIEANDLLSLKKYLANCLLYFLDRKKELAVVYPLTYSVINQLYNKGIQDEI